MDKKATLEICKNCEYWIKDYHWDKLLPKRDQREMGDCYHDPPKLCQNLIPAVVKEKGLQNLKNNKELFQFRPITEAEDFCKHFTTRGEQCKIL